MGRCRSRANLIGRWRLEVGGWLFVFSSLLLSGCAHFESKPIQPEKSAAQLESRRLDDPGLKNFLTQNLGHDLPVWPLASWNLPTLTLAAFYYQPNLEVARAQWRLAQAGVKTAGGRPNPTLSLVPGYDTSAAGGVNPWFPAVSFDLPLETAGKRGKRIAEASQLSESARLNIITAAWQTRSNVRTSLLDFKMSERRAKLLENQSAAQQQIVRLLQQRFDAGEIARPELTTAQIAMHRTLLDLADAKSKRTESRSRLAEAIGLSSAALDGVNFTFDFSPGSATQLTDAEARHIALRSRSDILAALSDYIATEDQLRLQIANQYPDVHLNPGYQFDQGDNKWSIGLTFELPVLNQNQGPIAEANAQRELSAAKFTALQAQVIGEIDRAVAGYEVAREQLETGNAMLAAQEDQQKSAQAQLAAGAADQLDSLSAQLEFDNASLAQLENESQMRLALGQLEDALQSPLTLPNAAVQVTPQNRCEIKPIAKHEP